MRRSSVSIAAATAAPSWKRCSGSFASRQIEHGLQRPELRRQLRQRLRDVHDADGERVFRVIRHASDQQLVHDDAETVEIGTAVERAAARLLGTHVVRRADDGAGTRHARGRIVRACDAEIGQCGGTVLAQQDVVGLHVAMHEALAVRVVQRLGHFAHDTQRERHVARLAVFLQHRAAGHVLHRDIEVIAMPADVMDADDMRMVQLRCDARLRAGTARHTWDRPSASAT